MTHKQLLDDLFNYYSAQTGEIGKSIDKDFLKQIISETIIQTAILPLDGLISTDTKSQLYNNAVNELRKKD